MPRYGYFIQVDEEALESVLTAHGFGMFGGSHANFIDAN